MGNMRKVRIVSVFPLSLLCFQNDFFRYNCLLFLVFLLSGFYAILFSMILYSVRLAYRSKSSFHFIYPSPSLCFLISLSSHFFPSPSFSPDNFYYYLHSFHILCAVVRNDPIAPSDVLFLALHAPLVNAPARSAVSTHSAELIYYF